MKMGKVGGYGYIRKAYPRLKIE